MWASSRSAALSVYIILATGQLSLGNAGFMAIGAYLTSYLTVIAGVPLTSALAISALCSGIIGVMIGFPALRLKGIFLAMATLGFGEMVRSLFSQSRNHRRRGRLSRNGPCIGHLRLDLGRAHSGSGLADGIVQGLA
ncbi:MAG: branched-chain amino acid ABC transporter permease [Bradyrhizobium sp.]